MKTQRFSQSRAAALMLVLWALMLLSIAVLAWAKWIDQDIALVGEANRNLEAIAMAHSGVAMALHPLVTRESPQLQKEFGTELGYEVRMISEGGKLHLNWLIAGEDPRKIALLKAWLERMGLDFEQREQFVDCLLDYVDGDNVKRLNGAEDEDDYHPANRPLQTLDELTQVRGTEALTSKPGWRESLTLYSQGPLDLVAAPAEILRAVPGFGDARIERFITYRAGKDGILGTMDDPPFKGLKDVQTFLGMTDAQFKQLGGLVSVNDKTMHITAIGHSGKGVRQVEVIARKSGANPDILYWKE